MPLPSDGRKAAEAAVATIVSKGDKQLVDITVVTINRDGHKKTGKLTATALHPSYLPLSQAFVGAGDLRVGDRL